MLYEEKSSAPAWSTRKRVDACNIRDRRQGRPPLLRQDKKSMMYKERNESGKNA